MLENNGEKNRMVTVTTDFQHTYFVIFPQFCNFILIVIHARPASELLLNHFSFINQFNGKLLNDFYIVS